LRALVDTHSFLWALLHDHRLTATAKQVLTAPENELSFSLVSLWEIAIKIKTGKLNAIGSSVSYIRDEMKAYGLKLLPIEYGHILQLENLPRFHGDPFDRLLIAQALHEGLPILTDDTKFREYGVQVIW
jgi:PIN domain nuclease of toxin-antitoxin system